MIRIEANYKNTSWVSTLWKLQLVLNITKQKTIQTSPLKILIGIEATTPVLRSLVRDVALESATPNRESMRELTRSRARQLLTDNMTKQDEVANRNRQHSRQFDHIASQAWTLTIVVKSSGTLVHVHQVVRGVGVMRHQVAAGCDVDRLQVIMNVGAGRQVVLGRWCRSSSRPGVDNDANATELDLPGSSFSTGPSTPSLNLNTEAGQAEAPGTEDEEAADNQVEDDQAAGRPF
ncbi:hypothetical protein ACJJTC_019012 [Scirpophaga incertulas]